MKTTRSPLIELLTWLAVAGNLLFVLWILYNGISEGFQGTLPEKISCVMLMGLLTVNAVLLIRTGFIKQKAK